MAKIIIIFLSLSFVFTGCSELETDNTRPRYDRDRAGSPTDFASTSACIDFLEEGENESSLEDIETTSFYSWLNTCRTSINAPDNTIDIVVTAIGLQDKYTPGRIRECLRCKLSDAHNRICSARDELERQRQGANSEADRIRIENSIYRLDDLQSNFNSKLYKQASEWNDRAQNFENKNPNNLLGRGFNWWAQQEAEGYRDIFNDQSYSECDGFYYDDVDEHRYEDDSRYDSYARRRSY